MDLLEPGLHGAEVSRLQQQLLIVEEKAPNVWVVIGLGDVFSEQADVNRLLGSHGMVEAIHPPGLVCIVDAFLPQLGGLVGCLSPLRLAHNGLELVLAWHAPPYELLLIVSPSRWVQHAIIEVSSLLYIIVEDMIDQDEKVFLRYLGTLLKEVPFILYQGDECFHLDVLLSMGVRVAVVQ